MITACQHDSVLVCGGKRECTHKFIAIELPNTNSPHHATIVCSAKNSCDGTVIYTRGVDNNNNYNHNYSSIICSGTSSCSGVLFYGIDNVYFLGTRHSDSIGKIYSCGRNTGHIFNVYIAASGEIGFGNLKIYCIENDECNLICDHYQGCINVTLHCFVNTICNVECNEAVYGIDEN